MRTLVVSDLHLGGGSGVDVLRHEHVRAKLLEEIARADRLVLLGDTLELRHRPVRESLEAARPVLQDLGEALPRDGEILLVAGNHDHALVAPWLEGLRQPLGLERRVKPGTASPIARAVATWLGRERTEVVYPGVWLRDDVYAMHGHYADPHGTVPTFERLAAGGMVRLVGRLPDPALAEDYERILAPMYAWIHASAQRAGEGRLGAGAGGAGKAYALLNGDGHRPLRMRALLAVFPLGIRGLNLLGIGPLSSDITGDGLRRSALLGTGEAVRRLGVEAEHVIFGHCHRVGPLAVDDMLEWRSAAGSWLYNSGCWVHEPMFTGAAGAGNPYWPGGAVLLEGDDPPRVLRLLDGVSLPDRE